MTASQGLAIVGGAGSGLGQALVAQHGAPRVVVHNPAALHVGGLMQTPPEMFEALWRASVMSAVHLAQATLPAMAAAGRGTFLVSGATASLRGGAKFAAFASAKFALRALAQSLAREYQPQGVHVAHVILDGIIDNERSRARNPQLDATRAMATHDIAQIYGDLVEQPKSAWTQELDLRPYNETF